jgi:hypothetical protein
MRRLARRYPVTAFVVLAFAITWSLWVPRALVSEGRLDSDLVVTVGGFWTYGPREPGTVASTRAV